MDRETTIIGVSLLMVNFVLTIAFCIKYGLSIVLLAIAFEILCAY